MRTVIPLSPELGNSDIGVLLDTAEQNARHPACAGGDVEVPQRGDVDGVHGYQCAVLLITRETMIVITLKGAA